MDIIKDCVVKNEVKRPSFDEILRRLRMLLSDIGCASSSTMHTRRSRNSSSNRSKSSQELPGASGRASTSGASISGASLSSRTLNTYVSLSVDEEDSRVAEVNKIYESGDKSTAEGMYLALAAEGKASAMHRLAKLYREKGKDDRTSLEWTRRAASRGHAGSMCRLGYAYEFGKGAPKDTSESVFWYKAAAEAGNAQAKVNFANCIERQKAGNKGNEIDAANHLREAAEMGNIQAMYSYGLYLKKGKGGKCDPTTAFSYFGRAAKASHNPAMLEYGMWLKNGWGGIEKDVAEGTMWIEKANINIGMLRSGNRKSSSSSEANKKKPGLFRKG